jgi:hypothetical protein
MLLSWQVNDAVAGLQLVVGVQVPKESCAWLITLRLTFVEAPVPVLGVAVSVPL